MNLIAQDKVFNVQYSELDESLKNGLKSSDPLVWNIISSINNIYNKFHDELSVNHANVGLIQFGNSFPMEITNKIVASLKTRQRVSPVDFINANAGAPLSIACTTYKFQGPTLVLTVPSITGRNIAKSLARAWLSSGQATYIFLVEAQCNSNRLHTISSWLLSL